MIGIEGFSWIVHFVKFSAFLQLHSEMLVNYKSSENLIRLSPEHNVLSGEIVIIFTQHS